MKDVITAQIEMWRTELQNLQQERAQLTQRLASVNVSIERHVGAITGAEQLMDLANGKDDEPAGVEVA